jgi:hypothetical protein
MTAIPVQIITILNIVYINNRERATNKLVMSGFAYAALGLHWHLKEADLIDLRAGVALMMYAMALQ